MRSYWKANRGFLIFIFLLLFVRAAIANQYRVPSGSMIPTIAIGDHLLVNRLAYDLKVPLTDIRVVRMGDPQRFDIIVFDSPVDGITMVKRLIGLPNDDIEIADGYVFVNGQKLPGEFQSQWEPGHYKVPEGHYFFMGDNRDNSADSRVWGYVPREKLIGRAYRVLWSIDFSKPIPQMFAWNRIAKPIN